MGLKLDSIESAIAAIAAGKPVIVVDDEDRENEGDLVMAATRATRRAHGLHDPPYLRHHLRAAAGLGSAPPQPAADGRRQRRAALDRLHGVRRLSRGIDHRHLGGRARLHLPRARQPQYRPPRLRAPRPRLPADRPRWRRAHAHRPYGSSRRSRAPRRSAADRRHRRARQRRRQRQEGCRDRGLRERAQAAAGLDRRSHRLSPEPREARHAPV